MKWLLAPLLALSLTGCFGTFSVDADDLERKAYVVAADYAAIGKAAAAYVSQPNADPWVKSHIKEADARATPAVLLMVKVVRGVNVQWCDSGNAPPNLDPVFIVAVCNGDVPKVIGHTAVLVGLFNSAVIQAQGEPS
jgi:hypothetical protein